MSGNDKICVFCGKKLSVFGSVRIECAGTYQVCCRGCANELKSLNEEELCRRALRYSYAHQPEIIQSRIEMITKAEELRPTCLQCGSKLRFEAVQYFDNSPVVDSVFSEGFEVLPAYCESCGKYEFYKSDIVKKNQYIAYLIDKDTAI